MPNAPWVFDGHNDAVLRLPDRRHAIKQRFLEGEDDGHLDLPRMRRGNFGGGFFAMFVEPCPETVPRERRRRETGAGEYLEPPPALCPAYASRQADELIDRLERLLDVAGEELRLATTVQEIETARVDDSVSVVLHLEGAEPVYPDLRNLDSYYDRGVRSIGLVWSRENAFAHGVPFEYPASPDTGPGLKPAGFDLVAECNRRGIVVDLAHCNETGFWDVAEVSSDPLVVSHAGVHEICRSTRNLTDGQLEAVADSDGLVGISFAASTLRPDGKRDPAVDVGVLVDHIEYIVESVGADHVALGSDFDGALIIDSVGDVGGLPDIFAALRARGYGDDICRKIASENWLRVLEQTWDG